MNIAVFVSGNGSNLQALIDAEKQGHLGSGRLALVVSDKPGAYALKRAEKQGIRTFVLERTGFKSREEYDRAVDAELEKDKIELVVLAGFLRILSDFFVDKYAGRLLNVHPALLPSFKGLHGVKDAFEHGVKITGVTVHFVSRELDSGPVIFQKSVKVQEKDTPESLEKKIHRVEHKLYPEAVRLFTEGKIVIEGRKVRILG
ncbi:MAG: phosphoribosylglycinamide formyltransferase [Candidatus Omnitrophica bacterium]|nr:phosphoribosylglycinamide formyltransferase [Candidatus Omnitrophota bacterium]